MLSAALALFMVMSEPPKSACTYDREVELSRNFVDFDQTEGQGWRPLYDAKCYLEAAQLLRDWQAAHPDAFDRDSRRDQMFERTLIWHEAQMWAFGGRFDVAEPIFARTYRGSASVYDTAWGLYVDGTLAFLRRDASALERAISQLSEVPKPPGWDRAVGADGKPITLPWPQNLDVLQGLERCWSRSYSEAYLCRDIAKPR
ncbi:MAG: hypothetical protein AAF251_12875 [Pseudomonadota bacterium]